jgi:hypothetical protein
MEKVSDNRHRQTTANTQQPKPTTNTNNYSRKSTVSTRQPTSDNQQQTATTDGYT